MANHALPTTTDLYTNVLTYLHARIDDASKWYDSSLTYTNPPTGVVRWNSTSSTFEKNTGTPASPVWTALFTALNININGTVGATTPAAGTFTTLTVNTSATLPASTTIGGGTVANLGNTAQAFTGQMSFTNATAPIIAAKIGPSNTQQHILPALTSDTIALVSATQTFTNKTYSSGALTGTFSGNTILSGQITFNEATAPIISAKLGPSAAQQHSLPAVASDTIALLTATQTFTNKTLTGATLTGSAFNGTIGATTPSSGVFTTLTANTSLNVTGTATATTFSGAGTSLTGTASSLSIGGTAAVATAVTITDDTTTATAVYPGWFSANTGNIITKTTSTKLSFVPSTGILTATGFAGPLTGNVTGNCSGTASNITAFTINQNLSTTSSPTFVTVTANLTGNCSGTASNITAFTINQNLSTTSSPTFSTVTANLTGTASTATQLSATQQTNIITGKQQSMSMTVTTPTSDGSFICRATGVGDGNLAGMNFYNDAYGIKLGVRADGVFGLGGWSRAAWSWYSDGSGNMVAAGNVTAYSDPKLKENFEKVSNPLTIIKALDGGTFNWKHGIPHTAVKAGKKDYGILADQVFEVMPEIVTESIEIDGQSYKTVSYEKLVPVLIEAIKELESRLIKLEGK